VLGGSHDLPMWVPVARGGPGRPIRLLLRSPDGALADVTDKNAVVDLHPLLVGVYVEGLAMTPRPGDTGWSLRVMEADAAGSGADAAGSGADAAGSGKSLGEVRLLAREGITVAGAAFHVFATTGCSNRSLGPLRLRANYLYERIRLFRDHNPSNEKMVLLEEFALWPLYFSPRPVTLVSFLHASGGNIFPMDLVGAFDMPRCVLSLDHRRPSLPRIREVGRLAISFLPVDYYRFAARMGRHHKTAAVDFASLPFATVPSPELGIPVPREALAVREVEIEQVHVTPTHALLFGRTLRLTGDGEQCLSLVHRLFQDHRIRAGRPLPSATARYSERA
jgi:flavin reductase (DIM6/NTAB) family NADH-FMN oxidoreductase RutF